jgi:hypothetical protein
MMHVSDAPCMGVHLQGLVRVEGMCGKRSHGYFTASTAACVGGIIVEAAERVPVEDKSGMEHVLMNCS